LDLLGAGLSIVFALGTKKPAFLAVPIFGIIVLFWLISKLKNKKIVTWVYVSLVVILIVSVFLCGQYLIHNGGELAGVPLIYGSNVSNNEIIEKIQYNFPRFLYQFIGIDGLPRFIQNELIPIKANLFQKIFVPPSIDLQKDVYLQTGFNDTERFIYDSSLILNEDSSWFGPLIFLLIPIAFVISLFSTQLIRRKYTIIIFILFFSYFIMVILQRTGWDPYQGRYFMIPVLPAIPFVSIILPNRKTLKTLFILFIVPFSLFLSFNTFFTNHSKPLINQGSFWRLESSIPENTKFRSNVKNYLVPKIEKVAEAALNRQLIYDCPYLDQIYYSDLGFLLNVKFLKSLIPEKESIYLNTMRSALDYGLFGKNMDRKLIWVNEIGDVPSGYFITNSDAQITLSKDVELLGDNGMYKVYFAKN